MNPHPYLVAIRGGAPEGFGWLCVTCMGDAYWQTIGGYGPFWTCPGTRGKYESRGKFPRHEPFAIDLKTGTIHLQQADGSIVEVPMAEWANEVTK